MRGAHRTRDATTKRRARTHPKCGRARGNEVGGVHVRAIGCFSHQQGDIHSPGEPGVCRDAELAHRLLVPEVTLVRESATQVDGIGKVEAGRTVIHERNRVTDMGPKGAAKFGVTTGVSPGMKLDGRVSEFETLVCDIEELFNGAKGGGRRVRGDLGAESAQQLPDRPT